MKSRLSKIRKKLIGTESPEELMDEIFNALQKTESKVPVVNGIYVFSYYAVTPNLLTDRHPLVGVTGVYDWGFTGINFHLNDEYRNYNYNQLASPLYKLRDDEVGDAAVIPFQSIFQKTR